MPELPSGLQVVLDRLSAVKPTELQVVLDRLAEPIVTKVPEIMEPAQPVEVTKTELTDLVWLLGQHRDPLSSVGYEQEDLDTLADAIVALRTVEDLFSTGLDLGTWKVRTVEEVVQASRAWRSKLRDKAALAFFFQPEHLSIYQDHNESGTIPEEVSDLRVLVSAAKADATKLARVGFTAEDITHGEQLLAEADGRDVLAIVGIRSQEDARILRNRLLTLAVTLGRYGRAAARAAFWDRPDKAALFERASFRNALRRLRPRQAKGEVEEVEPVAELSVAPTS